MEPTNNNIPVFSLVILNVSIHLLCSDGKDETPQLYNFYKLCKMPLNYVRLHSVCKHSMPSHISDKNILVQSRYRIYIFVIVSHLLQFEKNMNKNKV